MKDRAEEGFAEVHAGQSLLEDICWDFKEKGRRGALSRTREDDGGEARGAYSLVEKRCVKVEELLCGGDRVLE